MLEELNHPRNDEGVGFFYGRSQRIFDWREMLAVESKPTKQESHLQSEGFGSRFARFARSRETLLHRVIQFQCVEDSSGTSVIHLKT